MIAFHATFSAYGFWLPNDPRGSGSTWVGAESLYAAGGKATKVETTHSVASAPHDPRARAAVKARLLREPVRFTGLQARAIGRGFAHAVMQSGYALFACAILPDHVHVVVGACVRTPTQVVAHLKGAATNQLVVEGLHPFRDEQAQTGKLATCWGAGSWRVFLNSAEEVRRVVRYVEQNPVKAGKPRQRWGFVVEFRE